MRHCPILVYLVDTDMMELMEATIVESTHGGQTCMLYLYRVYAVESVTLTAD